MGRATRKPFAGDTVSVGLFALFCAAIALLGGASRADEAALIILRPLGIVLLAYTLWRYPWSTFAKGEAFAISLAALIVLCLVQLIPLSPSVWTQLPGREGIAEIDRLVFGAPVARPISVSPAGTWNALFYLLSLMGGYLLFLTVVRHNVTTILAGLCAIIIASVLVAFADATISETSFSWYAIVSPNPSGFFSNANHFGVASAFGILIAADLARRWRPGSPAAARWLGFAFAAIVLLSGVVLSGSRIALACAAVAFVASAIIAVRDTGIVAEGTAAGHGIRLPAALSSRPVKIALTTLLGTVVVAGFIAISLFQRELSIGSFDAPTFSEDLRFEVLPILTQMAQQQWLTGAGMGSFEVFYPMFESDAIMTNKYLNEAHNDVFQIIIEAGLVGALVVIGLTGWILWRSAALLRSGDFDTALLVFSAVVIVGVGSAFDYVLRTPLIAFIALACLTIWSSVAFSPDTSRHKSRHGTTLRS